MARTYKLKMIIGGAEGSGKTSFLDGKSSFNLEFNNLGVSFRPIECIINNGDSYQFICWDPNVKQRFRFLFPVFCRGVSCAILCFDISNHKNSKIFHLAKYHESRRVALQKSNRGPLLLHQ